ncbi:MAG: translational GTPase TypA [Proteobacteria bacterium]|jgi:GTP-binding protein|nr:translational GTPase TypA [Pseudomonadota bacterium]
MKLRNIAIIAHVDHGKTTLVDKLLECSGTLDPRKTPGERIMDSNDLEKERGITILAKNTAIEWKGHRINIVDTPGHADFGGEVERILSMVDSVLLLVDAVEGPMPQTRFVTQKAFSHGLNPILVVNKIDRDGARPDWVIDQTFDLFDRLGATDEQLDFPIIYTSALLGYSTQDPTVRTDDMSGLLDWIIEKVPPPEVLLDGGIQMQISQLDYSSYVGVIGIGRISRGQIKTHSRVTVVNREGETRNAKIGQILGFKGLERIEIGQAQAGDIVAITGIENLAISDTLCDRDDVQALPPLSIDEPTVSMNFQVNTSPLAGQEGKFLTSRQIRDRLMRELLHNVALRVDETEDPDKFKVSGRGELHLSVLLETMRREGFELAVSRPEVIFKEVDGEIHEPYEQLTVDVPEDKQGDVMQALAERGGDVQNMMPDGKGRIRLDYDIPSRGLIGFQTDFLTLTSGAGLIYHVFDKYAPRKKRDFGQRKNGVLVSMASGKALAYALFNLQERGRLLIGHAEPVYEGLVVGIHSRTNDLVVNPLKGKQLTNVRASGKDDAILLIPPVNLTLESALEFINDDELVEITPKTIRIRKTYLKEHERKRAAREV